MLVTWNASYLECKSIRDYEVGVVMARPISGSLSQFCRKRKISALEEIRMVSQVLVHCSYASLVPRLSVLDFVSQLWSTQAFRSRFCLTALEKFSPKLRDKI